MRGISLALALILAAAGGWWAAGFLAPTSPDASLQPVYDHQAAYHIASLGVPPKTEEYFMFDLNSESDATKLGQEMAEAFVTANQEKRSLGVIGDSANHNLLVLKKAVQASEGQTFPNLKIIVVGPKNNESNVQKTTAPLQAKLKYLYYP